MLSTLITILIVALVLAVLYWIVRQFLPPNIANIVGVILGLILLIYALHALGLVKV